MRSKGKDKANVDAKQKEKPTKNGEDQSSQQAQSPQQGTFVIQRLYTRGVSFDATDVPNAFDKEWKPMFDINIQTNNSLVKDNIHEVTLNVSVTAKIADKSVFTMGITQAGLFTLQNYSKEQEDVILGTECLKILYPYVREAITDLASRATFPQFYLTPINFDAMYLQLKQKREERERAQG